MFSYFGLIANIYRNWCNIYNSTFQDGGVLVNNPAAMLLHEAKQLWPNSGIQCMVSVGTGRHEPIETTQEISSINWPTLFRALLYSATDTEGIV